MRLQQRSECAAAPVQFRGVELLDGHLLSAATLRCDDKTRATVEFIGDSYFVGYGNLLPQDSPCRDGLGPAEVDRYTNTQQGMAALCGERLQLNWRISAISGRGVVRNYGGDVPVRAEACSVRRTLPECYRFSLHSTGDNTGESTGDLAAPYTDEFLPELIVINLGTNDFSTPLHNGERFRNNGQLESEFFHHYRRFLSQLAQHYPGVKFLLTGVPHPESPQQGVLLKRLARVLRGEFPLDYCQLPSVPLDGCDGHPGLSGHRLCADALVRGVSSLLEKSPHMSEEES